MLKNRVIFWVRRIRALRILYECAAPGPAHAQRSTTTGVYNHLDRAQVARNKVHISQNKASHQQSTIGSEYDLEEPRSAGDVRTSAQEPEAVVVHYDLEAPAAEEPEYRVLEPSHSMPEVESTMPQTKRNTPKSIAGRTKPESTASDSVAAPWSGAGRGERAPRTFQKKSTPMDRSTSVYHGFAEDGDVGEEDC